MHVPPVRVPRKRVPRRSPTTESVSRFEVSASNVAFGVLAGDVFVTVTVQLTSSPTFESASQVLSTLMVGVKWVTEAFAVPVIGFGKPTGCMSVFTVLSSGFGSADVTTSV